MNLKKSMNQFEALVISDIHLGSESCKINLLLDVLNNNNFNKLIIVGDAFEGPNINRLKHNHFKFLEFINKLTSPKKHIEVIWIKGNHDSFLFDTISLILGTQVKENYTLEINNNIYYFIHGHQFDSFIMDRPILTTIANFIYQSIQKIEPKKLKLSRYLKKTSKTWLRSSIQVAEKSVNYFIHHNNLDKNKKYHIICGHTHQAQSIKYENIEYWNCGCWTDLPCSYITIDSNGLANIHYIQERIN